MEIKWEWALAVRHSSGAGFHKYWDPSRDVIRSHLSVFLSDSPGPREGEAPAPVTLSVGVWRVG